MILDLIIMALCTFSIKQVKASSATDTVSLATNHTEVEIRAALSIFEAKVDKVTLYRAWLRWRLDIILSKVLM